MLKVHKEGLWTSVQDHGRFGYRHFGVPIAGAMDARSFKLANLLLNNPADAAVLEITMSGPELEFTCPTRIALTGGNMTPQLNNKYCDMNKVIEIATGDRLSFGALKYGTRTYLAIEQGFQSMLSMGSRSFYANITDQVKLQSGDELVYPMTKQISRDTHPAVKVDYQYFNKVDVPVYRGPEFQLLNEGQKEQLLGLEFSLSARHNRMAYQIDEVIENTLKPILTSAVMPGTVQLTPSGKLLILMRDCQTTGGYPRVLQLSEQAINQLAQKKQGDRVKFSQITL